MIIYACMSAHVLIFQVYLCLFSIYIYIIVICNSLTEENRNKQGRDQSVNPHTHRNLEISLYPGGAVILYLLIFTMYR
jgi:hypothetical protein